MIALACDHTGIELKKEMMKLLDSMGLEWKDFGTDTAVSCDYPVYGYRAAKAVAPKPLRAAKPTRAFSFAARASALALRQAR